MKNKFFALALLALCFAGTPVLTQAQAVPADANHSETSLRRNSHLSGERKPRPEDPQIKQISDAFRTYCRFNGPFLPKKMSIDCGAPVVLTRDPKNGLLTVPVTINGIGCRMLLDTGATHTTLDENFVKEHMPEMKSIPIMISGPTNVKGNRQKEAGVVEELRIGNSRFRDFWVMKHDLSPIRHNFSAGEVVGIIGISTLGTAPFYLDVREKTLTWTRIRPTGFSPVNGTLEPNGSLALFAKNKDTGMIIPFKIDCGASFTLVPKKYWSDEPTRTALLSVTDINAHGQNQALRIGIPSEIEIGDTVKLDAVKPMLGEEELALFGVDLLRRFVLYVDPIQNEYLIKMKE
ncbi:MAG: retroviral-like aspartic protease family protein [Opitutales bacterium]|nr:retroviral-like aspartic protease family protein [Opitutales bacterium]